MISNSDFSVSYLVFKTNPLISMLFTLGTNLSYTFFYQQQRALIYQYLIYQLQSLNQLDLFSMQNLKFQHVNYFLCLPLLHNLKDQL